MMVVFFLKTSLILLVAVVATALMRRSSAASRHVVWSCALLAVLCLPIASAVVPSLPLPWLPPAPTSDEFAVTMAAQLPERQIFEAVPAPPFRDPSPSARATKRAAPAVPTRPARPWAWLGLLWGAGAVVVLSRLAVGFSRRAALARRCTVLADSPLHDVVRAYAIAMGIARPLRILVAPAEMMPATWGLVRPIVLLPPSAHQWENDRLRLVLVHELSHVLRFDTLTAAIAYFATALAWWNPLVWFAAKRAQLERERACDDAVLRSGLTPSQYAGELLAIARSLPSPFAQRLALAMARPRGIERRIDAILDGRQRRTVTSHTVAVAASVLLAAQWPLAAVQLVPPAIAPVIARSSQVAAPPKSSSAQSVPDVIASRPNPPQYFEPLARMLNDHEWRAPTPDFSGHWRLDGSTAPLEYQAAQSVAPFGAEFIATQDGDGLAVEYLPVSTYSMGTGRGSLAQVRPVEGTGTVRFLFNGWATNQGGGVGQSQAVPSGMITGRSFYTVRDNTRWDNGVLDITTTETSNQQDYTTRIRRMRLDGDTIVVDTTTWSNHQPQVTAARYVRAEVPAPLSPTPQSGPQPIPYGQFGAGAYRPGNGVANPYRIREVKPVYTEAALKAGLQGTVELEAVVGADGAVTDVRVVRSLDDKLGLDENAKDVVRRTPFVPCKIGDKPVACLVVFEVQFTPGPPTPIAAEQFGAGAYRFREKAGMEEPVRLGFVSPQYTPEALRAKIEGAVELEFVILSDGRVGDVRVAKSLDTTYGLDQQAIKAIKATPFKPGSLNGAAVPFLATAELRFTLR